ncbi:ABC transporter ATP-binding protein [Nocardia stercoris]|uniref:ABC transporter ATP-binding protein n=1 Tax=Nocardia stercoris TaxID=2483361 RepID=A0A3M2LBW6_9NOCA|nr:ABC transporter ATP-binding protein [Nocardia stercoris]RMI33455.1 ABC transporter ATP-binding protein [Nocardia stercoris]
MLWQLIRTTLAPYRKWLLLVLVFQFVSTVSNLFLPSLFGHIVDKGVVAGNTGAVWGDGGNMLAVSLLQICAQGAATYYAARTGAAFGRRVRADLFHTVGGFSQREVNRFGAASLITRTTNDVQQVQLVVVMGLTFAAMAPIMSVGGIIMALREDVGLSWLMAVAVPVLGVVMGFVIANMVPGFRAMQRYLDVVNRVLREQLTGVRTIRAFVREDMEQQRFDVANEDLTQAGIRVMRLMAIMFPAVGVAMNVSTVAVWWFGGHRLADGSMQLGAITAYMSYLMQILMSIMMATFVVMMVPRAAVSAERITDVLATEPSVGPPAEPADVTAVRGDIEFDRVGLTYPGAEAPVLCDVSFRLRPGETLAVIGATGAGKTTLLSLVARLFDATAGSVRIDGHDIRDLPPEALWGHIGIVPQKAYLFTGTVAENLRYGRPEATDEELWAALRIAQAEDFVTAQGGLDATIAQGGVNVSGGQRQRLCIARAIVSRPAIYLFDDCFSALDLATDAALRRALAPEITEAAVVIVAQRVSTIEHADRILVLEAGQVVGLGSHRELLDTCPTYREIAESQNRQEATA